ncbi:tyrosine-type recombinase/integrase [Natronocalculus amylovorans]|uniref:Tyrosine-type recombinase/integrase n=1 Tax=Natronocalculus amylovorans TaxID=2917812 RepID=A0AAE3FXU2_9EURY|nr:tyrosine-type recombinase/integrase [Natronocalculus amylovorans]MCL9817299.1 tyrosine-type recombinase/integrase [Natronocalculus amylovorans]
MSATTTTDDPEDPIGYFLQDMLFHGKSERTRAAYQRVLRQYETFLSDSAVNPRGTSIGPGKATHRDCMAWIHSLRGTIGDSTIASYAAYLHRFYAYMNQVGVFEGNPMALVMEEMDETIDKDPERREITIPQMRMFVSQIAHPLDRVLVITLLKTGMRVGELCNLDLRDLSLTDPEIVDAYEISPRALLESRPNSLYVAAEPQRGEVYHGEERTASNKRKRDTVIPIDEELQYELKRWLAIRPDIHSPAKPLFVPTGHDWGDRITPPAVRTIVERYAREQGWYHTGGDASENVTPHYFRHFFTTHLRDRTGDRGIVKYLRGDVADDIIDTYTHNWGDQVRETYVESIYSIC